jgi:hypothetical protein
MADMPIQMKHLQKQNHSKDKQTTSCNNFSFNNFIKTKKSESKTL